MRDAATFAHNQDAPVLFGGLPTIKKDGHPMTQGDLAASMDRLLAQQWVQDWIANMKPVGLDDQAEAGR